jgi:hypothetical protein
MPKGNTLSRLMIVSLATAAIAAPAASAQPAEPVVVTPQDMAAVDLRTEATKPQTGTPVKPQTGTPVKKDMRTEAAKDPSRAPVTKQLPGPPTWPAYPRALTPPQQATVTDDGDGGGIEAPIVALIIASTLALGGGLTVAALRHRARIAH